MALNKKLAALLVCAVVLVVGAASATLAYFMDSEKATNTFTVGHVDITLDEAKVNVDGTVIEGADRVMTNEYHLIPGSTYTKDPTVHVQSGSEDCYIFVKLENELKDIIAATTVENQMEAKGWDLLDAENNIYVYKNVVEKSSKVTDVAVFEAFKVNGEVTKEALANYKDAKIIVTAYAVQAAGFDTAADAWDATFGK